MHHLAVEAGKKLSQMFGTEVLFADDSRYASMIDVRLPTISDITKYENLAQNLLEKYDTWVPPYAIGPLGGEEGLYYVRVSCQIYNEMSDIEFLGNAILN